MNHVIWLCATVLLSGPRESDTSNVRAASTVVVQAAVVVAREDIPVPSQEAGVIVALENDEGEELIEGAQVVKGGLMLKVDDSESLLQKRAAESEFESAKAQAENDSPIEAARYTTEVAKAEWDKSKEINKRSSSAISEFELRRLQLTFIRSQKQEDVARLEKTVAGKTMAVKSTQIDAAELDMKRRRIVSPVDGEVVEIFRKPGEWVNPGDAVVRVVRMNRVRVQGYLDAREFTPEQIVGRPVRVKLRLPDRETEFRGKLDYASSIVIETSESFVVWAEIENRRENGHWVLRPGLNADMTIDLSNQAIVKHEK